jgi:hypothetical protein
MPYRIAGIDVHKRMLAVVVSDVEVDSEFHFERRKFSSSPEQLRSSFPFAWRASPSRHRRKPSPPAALAIPGIGATAGCGIAGTASGVALAASSVVELFLAAAVQVKIDNDGQMTSCS